MNPQVIDENIAGLLLIISFYELISRFLVSLGKCCLPTTYTHPMVNVFYDSYDNETITKLINKSIKNKIEKLINRNSKINRVKLISEIDSQIEKLKTKVVTQTLKRNK